MIQEFKINNTKDVESFLHYLVNPQGLNLGMSFHPDDTFEDYINSKGERDVKFLTYIGAHPLMDTGTRDLIIEHGGFVENFTYDKWQRMVQAGSLEVANVLTTENNENNEDEKE